ncbi:MAG TPA: alpha-amylase family glycosyl hydrolase, partial [Fodinibius sp.]|nr:alpha-amylase family glycosyl hydrolase [Fodinibius sp.]
REVRDDLGNWNNIEDLSQKYNIMADLVINHTSRFSDWFENYRMGKEPGKDYFIEVNPSSDLSTVTRPRNSPLLTTVETDRGLRYVWTTFSEDQVDLDFSNPDVLHEFVNIFLFYLSKGISLIRLDAVAYLWKEIGTNSIHLKETHQIIKLFRDLMDHIAPNAALITETNVPFDENINYFGEGDEAHMIYQFSLPPLLLHAILKEKGQYITQWAKELPEPPEGCTYFNFTASHDGIGVRPLEGLVPDEEFDYLVQSTQERGGFVSYKENRDKSQSPYELNITFYDAFAEPGKENTQLQVKRYLCSQIIMLSLQGVPGIYFHNLTATKNHLKGVANTGEKRAINRKQWQLQELEKHLADSHDITHYVLKRYKQVLQIRKKHPAFSPQSPQEVLDFGHSFFAFRRSSGKETILCISNITHTHQIIENDQLSPLTGEAEWFEELLANEKRIIDPKLKLKPFETVWLVLQ